MQDQWRKEIDEVLEGKRRWCVVTGDCLEVLPLLPSGCVDAVVTDPPYGIGYDASESSQQGIQRFGMLEGDGSEFDPSHLMHFPDAILWGCNNYCRAIPPREGQWYFWDKVTRNSLEVRIAEGEFAWHKRGTKPRAFRHLWSGAYRDSENGLRSLHPTQKPIALMKWCIERCKLPPNSLILDAYAGSGTTGVAAALMGMRAILIERDKDYADIARRRCEKAEREQRELLFPAIDAPRQQTIEDLLSE